VDLVDEVRGWFRKDEVLFYRFAGVAYLVHAVVLAVLFVILEGN
jgi:hypothetical protein